MSPPPAASALSMPARDDLLALDERARREALDSRRSLLLQAPAGSGKTTVLTARFLALLSTVDTPEQIVAITFTRKAAAEMRQRVVRALQGDEAQSIRGVPRQLLEAARQRDQQLGWQLTQNPAQLRIQTVDALNHWIAQALPVAARTAPTLRISDAPSALYLLAARRCLQSAWTEPSLQAAAELLFARLDNRWSRLECLMAEMLERRSHWLPRLLRASSDGLVACVGQALEALIRSELSRTLATLPGSLVQDGCALLERAQSTRGRAALSSQPADLDRWRALTRMALTEEGGWRRQFKGVDGVIPGDKAMRQRVLDWIAQLRLQPGAQAVLKAVRDLPDARLPGDDAAALEALAQLLRRGAAELKLVFAERARADHTEMAAAAREGLIEQGDPSEFGLRAGGAIRHILVDEFQDTSIEQFEMLRSLTAGWVRGDGRTVFLVGDPMQSIYQFREAEVGLFLRARDRGLGELQFEPLQLRRNFRTRAALLEWINERFARLFPEEDDARLAAIRYLPSVAAEPSAAHVGGAVAAESPVTLHRFEAGDSAGEALRVLEIVRRERAAGSDTSIAVLVASREHAAAISSLLRAAGVAVRGVDLEPLRDRPVIRDLSALTRALMHAADRTAWLALLRAPWCGLTLTQLEWLCPRDDGDFLATLSAQVEVAAPVGRVVTALWPALRGAERTLALWQRVERCWLRLAGPAIYSTEIDRMDARRFLDALATHDLPESLVGEALTDIVDGLYSAGPVLSSAVEIMTMHSAKGLEWDVVILPGLARTTARDQDRLLQWLDLPRPDTGTDLLLCPIRETLGERRSPARGSLEAYIKAIRRERTRIERVRLLYVAATRARRSLHLMGALEPGAAGELPKPRRDSLLGLLWPVLGEQFLSAAVEKRSSSASIGGSEAQLLRLPEHWRLPEPPAPLVPQRMRAPSASLSIAPEYRWVGVTARAVGTIVHAELHRLALTPLLPEADEALARLPDYGIWLAELQVPAPEHALARERIARALESTLKDARGRWLLDSSHSEARSEWRLTGVHQGCLVTVVFDRMLVDKRGERWVIDFKTSAHEGAGRQEFIEAEMQRYRDQLARYGALARALGPEPTHVALYFPLLGVFRELSNF